MRLAHANAVCSNTLLTAREDTVIPILRSHPFQLVGLTIALFATITLYSATNGIAADQSREGPHSLIHRPAAEHPALSAPTQGIRPRPLNDQPPHRTNQVQTPKTSTSPTIAPVTLHRTLAKRPAIALVPAPATSSQALHPSLVSGTATDTTKTTAPPATAPTAKSSASPLVGAASIGAATAPSRSSTPSPRATAATASPVASPEGGSSPPSGRSRSVVNLRRNSAIASLLQAPTPVVSAPPAPPPSPIPPSTPPPPSPSTGNITLTWMPNREPDLAGYKVYVGTASGRYDFPGSPFVAGTVTSYTVLNLPQPQTYFFALSAYDNAGNESGLSAEVSKSLY